LSAGVVPKASGCRVLLKVPLADSVSKSEALSAPQLGAFALAGLDPLQYLTHDAGIDGRPLRVFLFRHRLRIGVLAPVEEAGDAAERDKDQEKILSRYPANRSEQRSAATNHRRGDHLFRFPPRRTTAGRCNRYRGRLFLGHRRRLDLQPRRPELEPRAPYAPQRAFSAPTCRRPAASVSLELKDVVGAVAGRTSEIRANRSKRSARPFLPPLIFFVIVSASPSSAQRLRVARIPVEQRHQAFPRVGIHRV
jgi:hypothetical protein